MSESDPSALKPPSSREKGLIANARQQVEHKADSSHAPRLENPPNSFPGFDVVREIHRGGQGVVFQAIQKATKRKVAIKVFHEGPYAGARDRARFEREVDILATLDHPNIVGIIDRGTTENGSFFFVMDYVSGKTLDVFMADTGRSIDEMLVLFGKICDAVNAAHLKGIIHRDLKPSNIRVDQGGEPHVLDFGLAKTTTSEVLNDPEARLMTMTGQFIGSLPWASPEQASGAGANVDIRADVYSLGVILYQLLTGGRFPYPVIGNMRDVLDNIMRAEPAKPSTIRRQINDEVETIVLKSLSKDRERRYQSAGDLSRDVKRYLNGEPIEAKRDSGWYLLNKTIRRHKGSVSAAAAFVMLLAASSLVTGFLYSRAAAARVDAEAGEVAAVAARVEEKTQRELAEENFKAVRGLVRVCIFDFSDAIANLRGATKVRERLLTEALSSLRKVQVQGGEDPAFLRELADSYERLGDIQKGLFMPSVGGSVSAEGSFAESRRLREAALVMMPRDAKLIGEHAQSIQRTAWVLREQTKNAEAASELEKAVARADDAIAATPQTDQALRVRLSDLRAGLRLEWANTIRWLVPTDKPGGDRLDEARAVYAQTVAYWQDRVITKPDDGDAAKKLGVALDQQSGAELAAGDRLRERAKPMKKDKPEAALTLARESMPLFERSSQLALDAAARFEKFAAAHPESGALARDHWLALHNSGNAMMQLGYAWEDVAGLTKDEEAKDARSKQMDALNQSLSLYDRALPIAESLWNSDHSDLNAQRDWATMLNKVGTVLIDLQQWERSATILDRSIAVRDEVFRTDATHMYRRDLAQAICKRALLDRERAEKGGVQGAERAELLRAAIERYERGLEHLMVLQKAGVQSENSGDIPSAKAGIKRCQRLLDEPPKGSGN